MSKVASTRRHAKIAPVLGPAVFCLIVLVLSARLFMTEYGLVLQLSGTTNDRIAAFSAPDFVAPRPQSARSAREVLASCGRVLTIAPSLKADPALARIVARNCATTASVMLERGPSNGRALAVLLFASPEVDPQAYLAAQSAAPYESWALNLRLLAFSGSAPLTARLIEIAEADISRAILSDWGRSAIARIYRDKPSLRPAITRVAERAPAEAQAAFLRRVTQLARSTG